MDFNKLKKKLKIENNIYIILIILIGVVFMLFPSDNNKKDNSAITAKNELNINDEKRIEKILSQIDGAGSVSVMVTYTGGIESQIAYETNSSKKEREDGDKTKSGELVTEKQAIMSSGEPFVSKHIYPEIKGVVVAAEGADLTRVRQQISDAVTTAFGIAPHKVCIIKKSK